MCFDICTINIRVSIRVRGLHLVFNVKTVKRVILSEYNCIHVYIYVYIYEYIPIMHAH